jgi:hypothetical protein
MKKEKRQDPVYYEHERDIAGPVAFQKRCFHIHPEQTQKEIDEKKQQGDAEEGFSLGGVDMQPFFKKSDHAGKGIP